MIRFMLVALLGLIVIACPAAPVATLVFNKASTSAQPQVPVTGSGEFGGCGGPVIDAINPNFEQAVVEQTNEIRMQNGLSPLKRVDNLDKSARYHSADMSSSDYFSHDTLSPSNSGRMTMVCDTWARIEAYYSDWEALAENIAAGQRTPEMAMNGWMNSPDHRHNILSSSYSEIGVGFYEGSGEYHYYWDQNFGRRNGVYPLVIDGEKAKTSTRVVPVYIYGDWSEMRLRNDNGEWGGWQPFKTNFDWTLPGSTGSHTITAELRGADGHSTSADAIDYEP